MSWEDRITIGMLLLRMHKLKVITLDELYEIDGMMYA